MTKGNKMKLDELSMRARVDIDARQIASTLVDMDNEAARLRREADTHARDADRVSCEARGMEASATMIRVSLGVALSNVPVIAES